MIATVVSSYQLPGPRPALQRGPFRFLALSAYLARSLLALVVCGHLARLRRLGLKRLKQITDAGAERASN